MKSHAYPFNQPHIERRILEHESKAVGQKFEVGFVFDPSNGNLIDCVQGNEREVTFEYVQPNMVVSHYHPKGDSFTRIDLVRAIQLETIEMRAFGREYLYLFREVYKDISLGEWEGYLDKNPIHSCCIGTNDRLIVSRNVEKDKHKYWNRVSKEIGFIYVREDRRRCINELEKNVSPP